MHDVSILASSNGGSSISATYKGIGTTKALLSCAVIAGPIFLGLTFVQMIIRTGFDITRGPLSLLSLGKCGWV
jgi:hypothetical protein